MICSEVVKVEKPEKKEIIQFKNKKEAIEAFKMLLKDKVSTHVQAVLVRWRFLSSRDFHRLPCTTQTCEKQYRKLQAAAFFAAADSAHACFTLDALGVDIHCVREQVCQQFCVASNTSDTSPIGLRS